MMTTKQIEALQLALENICAAKLCEFNSMSSRHEMIRLMDAAITAIREAMAHAQEVREQPAQQEPVAWLHPANATCVTTDPTAYARGIPLYTSPQRKPLTDEEISAIDWKAGETLHDFARAIEAAHGITGENT